MQIPNMPGQPVPEGMLGDDAALVCRNTHRAADLLALAKSPPTPVASFDLSGIHKEVLF
jgi:hypothetical protein